MFGNQGMKIPKGKEIRISVGGTQILPEQQLIIESDITISLSSSFEPFLGGGNSKIIDVLGAVSRDVTGVGFSGQFKQLGMQVWTGTDPVSISSITIGFYIDKTNPDAYEQVYLPMIELSKLPLPSEGKAGNLVAPGPSVLAAFGSKSDKATTQIIGVEIGNILNIRNAIIKKAEPTFSSETDENDYPIWGKISLDVISVYTATKEILSTTFNGPPQPRVGGL